MTVAEKLTAVAENMSDVYEAGKKAEYDVFWGTLQNNGEPKSYNWCFSGPSWTDEVYNPKYPIN